MSKLSAQRLQERRAALERLNARGSTAVEIDHEQASIAWRGLGSMLAPGERVHVKDVEYGSLECLAMAVQCMPSQVETWSALADAFGTREAQGDGDNDESGNDADAAPLLRSILVDGAPLTRERVNVHLVKLNCADVVAWCGLGDMLYRRHKLALKSDPAAQCPTVTVNAAVFTAGACYAQALHQVPDDLPEAWLSLAQVLEAGTTDKARSVEVGAKRVTPLDCYAMGLGLCPEAGSGATWTSVASYLAPHAERGSSKPTTVVVGSLGAMTQRDMLVRALEEDQEQAEAWFWLGTNLLMAGPDEAVTLRLPDADASAAAADDNVADDDTPNDDDGDEDKSAASDTPEVRREARVTALECLISAADLDAEVHPQLWTALASLLRGPEAEDHPKAQQSGGAAGADDDEDDDPRPTTVVVQGNAMDKQQCLVQALNYDANNSIAWHSLSALLDTDDRVIVGGVERTAMECVVRTLELDDDDAEAWYTLATTMPTGGTVDVKGWQYSDVDALTQSLRRDPSNADAWYALGSALLEGAVVKVGERMYGELKCYVETVSRCDMNARAWNNIGGLTTPGGTTYVPGVGDVAPHQSYLRALGVDDTLGAAWRNLHIYLTEHRPASGPAAERLRIPGREAQYGDVTAELCERMVDRFGALAL